MSGSPEKITPNSTGTPTPSPLQSSIAAAIANFKPSSRDVISGIAPHVFEDRRRPRLRRGSVGKRASKSFESPRGAPESSPLRLSAVITVDEHGILVEQRHRIPEVVQPIELMKCTGHVDLDPQTDAVDLPLQKVDKRKWRSLRIDIRVLKKTIAIKLRPTTRSRL